MALLLALPLAAQAGDPPQPGDTRFGVKLFVDASHLEQSNHGVKNADASGTAADLKRFYFIVDHAFSKVWSARVITDVHWTRHQDPSDVWLRNAYLQGDFSPAFQLKLGVANTPWIALISKWYGYRYIEAGLLSRSKMGSAADWGVQASGRFGPQRQLSYAAAIITGAGYKKPRVANGPDVMGLVGWQPVEHMIVALGAYSGKVGDANDHQPDLHTARRWNAMLGWADARWRLGGQYYRTDNWNQVSLPLEDASHGWEVWSSVQIRPRWSVFARHDDFKPSTKLDSGRHDRYTNAGLEWRAEKWLRLAAVYKHGRLERAGSELKSVDEIGLWAQIAF